MKNKNFTKNEIKLYENLAQISDIRIEILRLVGKNLDKLINISNKQEWFSKIMDKFFEIDKVISQAKIPKKFLILNSLESKDEK